MKKVLISGLNTYLGRRASCYLQTEDFDVTGLVRNLSIFNKIVKEKVTARLFELDLLRKGPAYDNFQISDVNFAIYFTQVPTLDNDIQLQLELLGLRNFVEICKRAGNNRVIYVARLMDEHFLEPVRNLFEALRVQYTIVVKSSVIGKESVLNRIFWQTGQTADDILLELGRFPEISSLALVGCVPLVAGNALGGKFYIRDYLPRRA